MEGSHVYWQRLFSALSWFFPCMWVLRHLNLAPRQAVYKQPGLVWVWTQDHGIAPQTVCSLYRLFEPLLNDLEIRWLSDQRDLHADITFQRWWSTFVEEIDLFPCVTPISEFFSAYVFEQRDLVWSQCRSWTLYFVLRRVDQTKIAMSHDWTVSIRVSISSNNASTNKSTKVLAIVHCAKTSLHRVKQWPEMFMHNDHLTDLLMCVSIFFWNCSKTQF